MRIKGADEPVRARRLVAIGPRDGLVGRAEASLVGRRWEMAALDAMVDRAIGGRGGVVNVVGPPGIGKSRVAREAAALAAGRGVEVFWTFCESHASDIPFHVVTRLLRAGSGVADLDGEAARARVREQVPDADPQDLLLLDDLLGIADPDVALPQIDPDARRRRLTALINTASLARTEPALFIIEDAHWIDAVSESMLADFLTVIPRTPSMVLITSRPEYDGALTRVHGAQTIALAPLGDSDTAALIGELLGSDPSVGELAAIIADRAAGNPFFAEEMVRELVQRGVLAGERGGYVCRADVAEVSVPATVQAAIAARIDRLTSAGQADVERGVGDRRPLRGGAARRAGHRCGVRRAARRGADRSGAVHPERRVRLPPPADPRGGLRITAEIRSRRSGTGAWPPRSKSVSPASVEENAALIAEHLEAAGELHAAYGWHMRAAAWSTNRDIGAARLSWERARRIADALPADDPDQLSMRIAPRTMLCATDWQARAVQESRGRFAELRELCSAAGDKVSLAIGMSGLVTELLYAGRSREGSRLASEQMALLESIGDPTLTMGLAFIGVQHLGSMPVSSARSCGGRRPSSTWPPVTPPRAPASVLDHRWRSRWHGAALLGGGWAVPDGARTSTTPSRWPETATRQPSPLSSPGPTTSRSTTGCFGPTTPPCARCEEAVQAAADPATISRCAWPSTRWVLRCCVGTPRPTVTAGLT